MQAQSAAATLARSRHPATRRHVIKYQADRVE
jgi:hypothetical protein